MQQEHASLDSIAALRELCNDQRKNGGSNHLGLYGIPITLEGLTVESVTPGTSSMVLRDRNGKTLRCFTEEVVRFRAGSVITLTGRYYYAQYGEIRNEFFRVYL